MGKIPSITTRVWYNEKILFLKDYSGKQSLDKHNGIIILIIRSSY